MTWSLGLYCIVAAVLTRLKALRTMVQFKGILEKASIRAEAVVDINIPSVILGWSRS